MNILDRYILKEFTKLFLLIVVSLICLYLIVDFFERIRMFLSNHATAYQILSYFAFTIPTILSQMIPVGILLSSLLTFGILSKNSEITAMKANGVSLYRTALPVIIFSLVVSGFVFLLNEFMTPYTNQKAKYIKLIEVQKREKLGSFKNNQIWYRGKNGIYNISMFDPETGTLRGIRISYLDRDMNLTKRIDAKEAQWKDGKWIFHNLLITTFPHNDFPHLEVRKSSVVDLPEKPSDFMIVQKNADEMGFGDLKTFIRKIQAEGYDATQYLADMHGKIAFPFVCIILSILGVSFSLLRQERKGGIAQSIGAGIVIGFSYWIVFAFSISLGRSGTMPPLLAAWTANILFGIAAFILFIRIKT
jgi:lipopolysaccharide export system permease protein